MAGLTAHAHWRPQIWSGVTLSYCNTTKLLAARRLSMSVLSSCPSKVWRFNHYWTWWMMPGLACCIVKSVECNSIYRVSYIRISLRRPEKNCEKLWSSGKGQARMGKGWPLRWKASKLEALPRAYTKVGCHPPPPPPPTTHHPPP